MSTREGSTLGLSPLPEPLKRILIDDYLNFAFFNLYIILRSFFFSEVCPRGVLTSTVCGLSTLMKGATAFQSVFNSVLFPFCSQSNSHSTALAPTDWGDLSQFY